jgi:hypothetical protein
VSSRCCRVICRGLGCSHFGRFYCSGCSSRWRSGCGGLIFLVIIAVVVIVVLRMCTCLRRLGFFLCARTSGSNRFTNDTSLCSCVVLALRRVASYGAIKSWFRGDIDCDAVWVTRLQMGVAVMAVSVYHFVVFAGVSRPSPTRYPL